MIDLYSMVLVCHRLVQLKLYSRSVNQQIIVVNGRDLKKLKIKNNIHNLKRFQLILFNITKDLYFVFIKIYITIIKTTINTLLDKVNFPLNVNHIQTNFRNYQVPFTPEFFLTFAIIIVLLTLVLVSTLLYKTQGKKILSAFSIQQTNKLFKYHEGSRLNVLNGIRSLSMFWVIYGHVMSMAVGYSLNIATVQKNILFDWRFLTVQAGLYSVDVFFFVGGFLLAYGFLKEKDKIKSNSKYGLAILNRYLRIVPSYFIAIMIYYSVYPHLGNGPFWDQSLQLSTMCHSLWRPLLFIDNLVDNANNMCMAWGWYLQNDMQLFLYCMIILYIYNKSKTGGYLIIFLSMAVNFGYVMQQTYDNGQKWLTHISDAANSQKYQLDIYYKPWSRCPPYLYGLLLGIFYQQFMAYQTKRQQNKSSTNISKQSQIQPLKSKQNINQSQYQNIQQNKPIFYKFKQYLVIHPNIRRLIQFIGIGICLFICFIPRTAQGYDKIWSQFVHSIYLTYAKLLFVIGVSFIIIPSILLPIHSTNANNNKQNSQKQKSNYNTLVRFLLDTKLFNYIAKVSFCTYLIHLTILLAFFNSSKTDVYYALYPTFTIFVTFVILSTIAGTVLVYLVESPFSKLQKQLLSKLVKKTNNRKSEKKVQIKQNENEIKNNNPQQLLMKEVEIEKQQNVHQNIKLNERND